MVTAWNALLQAKDPKEIMSNRRLSEARREINVEVERQTHTPPKFSKDGKTAVLKINCQAQVHPVIATRWASLLFRFINILGSLKAVADLDTTDLATRRGENFARGHKEAWGVLSIQRCLRSYVH